MTLREEYRYWSLISIIALAIAGVFALLLVFSRTPYVQDILPWPWKSFFHKGLVTHVIFSFVVWFLATMGAFWAYSLAQQQGDDAHSKIGGFALLLAVAGCLGLILPALLDLGEAELNNYVPVMTHWLYYLGLVLLAAGLLICALRQMIMGSGFNGQKATAILYIIALICFTLAYSYLPDGLSSPTYNERLFWGGGHVLQFVNTALLFLAWQFVARDPILSPPYVVLTFGILVVFVLPTPITYLIFDVLGQVHRDFYTDLLRYGLLLPSLIFSLGLIRFLVSEKRRQLDRLTQQVLWLSLITYNLGGLYGLLLDGTDTRVPAHYHAVIGGINLSFMIFYHRVLLPAIEVPVREGRLFTAQYWLYGLGQIMHASGMFLAGSMGVPRKTSGDAQALDSLEKVLSMGLMGIGGIIAVLGGVLFVIMTLKWMMSARRAG
ncbi:cbb3-type cytochrome c oxidase subunit I [Terasakiella pusilla]|uniref:cbb3-type cytochrome c oxidase subunit I n=1 Tax=Terasakiella pusilla TaxID=64973 RepID=UPI003AA90EA3